MKKLARKSRNSSNITTRKKKALPVSEKGHKVRFDQLLDDAVIGVKKK